MKNYLKNFYNNIFLIKKKICNYLINLKEKFKKWKSSSFDNKFLNFLYLNLRESDYTKKIRENKKLFIKLIDDKVIEITNHLKSFFKWFLKRK